MDYPLPPIIHPDVENLLHSHTQDIYQLLDLFESPLKIVFPEIMRSTIRGFRETLDASKMRDGQIYFATKTNKANAFLAASAASRIGVDASSIFELRAALSNGVPGSQISISGTAKPPELIALACQHNCRIAIDEPSEIDQIVYLSQRLGLEQPARIYLRITPSLKSSRFGMDDAAITGSLKKIRTVQPNLQLDGFSFHVPGYESDDRVRMIDIACQKLIEAADIGLQPARINIGGGYRAAYASAEKWDEQRATERDFAGNVKPRFIYPYAQEPSGPVQLKEILSKAGPVISATAHRLQHPVTIDIEPGRSAVEHAGITVFQVSTVRNIGDRPLIVVDGSSRDLADSFAGEFLIDPGLITDRDVVKQTFTAAIASNTCKEDDYLARRFIPLPFKPEKGDLLVYVNTAGYQMDSKESPFHRHPLAPKIVASKQRSGWRFVTDHTYSLADSITAIGADA